MKNNLKNSRQKSIYLSFLSIKTKNKKNDQSKITVFYSPNIPNNDVIDDDIDRLSASNHRELVLTFDLRLQAWKQLK